MSESGHLMTSSANEHMPEEIRVLVTGGGTGGHVSPALAVIEELRRQSDHCHWTLKFLYVGSEGGVERELAGASNVPFTAIRTGKLRRSASILGLFTKKNVLDLVQVPLGILQASGIIKRFRPTVVFSTGGYVSVPAVVAAGRAHIPVLVHEQTVQIGLANRITAKYASALALSFDGTQDLLSVSNRRKAFISGNPVRRVIFNGSPRNAVLQCGFSSEDDGMPTVYVTGGAQGSHVINEAVKQCLPELLRECRIMHQCGVQPSAEIQDVVALMEAREMLPESLKRRYFVTEFVKHEIGDFYALADILVSRSGAGTVAEAAALGKPAVYVPLVPTGGDEQSKNAARFSEIGAAVVIKQSECSGTKLMETIRPLLDNPDLRRDMGTKAMQLSRPNAAVLLTQRLLQLAKLAN